MGAVPERGYISSPHTVSNNSRVNGRGREGVGLG